MTRRVTRGGLGLLLLAALWLTAQTGSACPFCDPQAGKTFTTETADATMVLFGKLTNANEKAETTDIEIDTVIKDDPTRGKKDRLTMHRYVDLSLTTPKDRYLVFCEIYKGKIEPYRGMALKVGSKLPEYLRGALQFKDRPVTQRLRFFFDYLDNSDLEISTDAYKEFAMADYPHFKAIAKDLPSERVTKWLQSDDVPAFRVGLYAAMLGHCGKDKDAGVLKKLLDNPERRAGSGVDGVMAAYALLKPKEGWKYITDSMKNAKEDFTFRYAALRSVRFLHDYRDDVVGKKQLVEAVCQLLDQEDIADLAIEDLRKWQSWTLADKVLGVTKTDAYKQPIVKRAVLRYCLQCKDSTTASAYVAARRKADPKAVEEAEELLKLEQEAAPVTPPAKK